MGRYGTGPRSFGATFWNPGFKTEKTAKKREKTGQKWARYGLRKRVRVADLFLMDRYGARALADAGHSGLAALEQTAQHEHVCHLAALPPQPSSLRRAAFRWFVVQHFGRVQLGEGAMHAFTEL